MTKSEYKLLDNLRKKFMNSIMDFHILKQISQKQNTGYIISKRLKEKHSKITVSLIYLKLNNLEKHGYISHKLVRGKIDKKEYTLTKKGQIMLKHLESNIKKMMEAILQ